MLEKIVFTLLVFVSFVRPITRSFLFFFCVDVPAVYVNRFIWSFFACNCINRSHSHMSSHCWRFTSSVGFFLQWRFLSVQRACIIWKTVRTFSILGTRMHAHVFIWFYFNMNLSSELIEANGCIWWVRFLFGYMWNLDFWMTYKRWCENSVFMNFWVFVFMATWKQISFKLKMEIQRFLFFCLISWIEYVYMYAIL